MFWFILTFIFVILAAHPFVTYPLSLMVAAPLWRRRAAPTMAAPNARIAILFCAYNEEAVIQDKLNNCMDLLSDDPLAAVYVYTDGCADRTVEIATSFGDRVTLIEGKERRGKSSGMNQIVQLARDRGADILFFTDANVILRRDVLQIMQAEFAAAAVGCVTGHLEYVNGGESATALVGARYWTFDEAIKRLESRTGSCVGADGSIFAIRASLYRKVPENIIDDFFTSMSVLCDGWRCVHSAKMVAYERSATRSVEEYRRKIRIACRAFNCHRLLWPRLCRLSAWDFYKYVSHKFLRWLSALWIAGALASATLGLLTLPLSWSVLALVALIFCMLGFGAAWLPGAPWIYAREGAIAIAATGLGVIKSLQGERFQTWSQAVSTRQLKS